MKAAGTGYNNRRHSTININARFDVRHLVSLLRWLDSEGVIVRASSNIPQDAVIKMFYHVQATHPELIEMNAERAYEELKRRGLVQGNSMNRERFMKEVEVNVTPSTGLPEGMTKEGLEAIVKRVQEQAKKQEE